MITTINEFKKIYEMANESKTYDIPSILPDALYLDLNEDREPELIWIDEDQSEMWGEQIRINVTRDNKYRTIVVNKKRVQKINSLREKLMNLLKYKLAYTMTLSDGISSEAIKILANTKYQMIRDNGWEYGWDIFNNSKQQIIDKINTL